MRNKRTKATDISSKVREQVKRRDSINDCPCCIFCGRPYPEDCMHYIPRSSGGLGITENLAMGCRECHMKLDQSTHRKSMLLQFKTYLMIKHRRWNEEELIFKKGR